MTEPADTSPAVNPASGGVWVLGEVQAGELLPVSLELLAEGVKLAAKLNTGLGGVLLGDAGLGPPAELMAAHGAQKVFLVQSERLVDYNCELYTEALSSLIGQHRPDILIAPATPNGNDYLPRVAARTRAAFIPGCILLEIDETGALSGTRPVYGGKFSATVKAAAGATRIVTVRPGTIEMGQPDDSRKAEVIEVRAELKSPALTERVGFIEGDPSTVDLTEADIIVAGGRGARNRDGWSLVESLAGALRGSLGGSRVAYDEGWMPFDRQIGQTGKTIRPRLYIACGISGSIYHTAGINDAERIIAINTDPEAEIFKVADVGVKSSLNDVIPVLIEKINLAAADKGDD